MEYIEIETQIKKTYFEIVAELREIKANSSEFDDMDINEFILEYYQEIQ